MKVYTVVHIIERDCDSSVWTFRSLKEAINKRNELVYDFAETYGIKFLNQTKVLTGDTENKSKTDNNHFCYMEGGFTDRQIIIRETEL